MKMEIQRWTQVMKQAYLLKFVGGLNMKDKRK